VLALFVRNTPRVAPGREQGAPEGAPTVVLEDSDR